MWETLNQRIWISDNIKDKRILNQLANENESQSQSQPNLWTKMFRKGSENVKSILMWPCCTAIKLLISYSF